MVVLFVHCFRIETIAFVDSLKMASFLLWYLDVVSRACFSALSSAVRDGRVLVELDFCG